jgi:hypothetical protein
MGKRICKSVSLAFLEVGSWKLEVGSWKLEVGSWKLEVGSWKLEVGRLELELDFVFPMKEESPTK